MQDPFVLSDFDVLSARVTECCCRDSLSTETNKKRREDLERDTASSGGMLPPPLAEDAPSCRVQISKDNLLRALRLGRDLE